MANNKDSRYDVKTEGNAYNPFGAGYKATVRDNKTGKTYTGSGSSPEKARDAAWRNTPKN
ncbi:MAG: hypothetical protein F6K54_21160 [Okeania sp. SIO3B5]|uniref:hypothetical protein n=1 Tax=Okeania sp. SIO3B5 TaxID=2607811 RepID=UPI0013FF8842|nr:hypothetical protein [Okeania sp. SIO3B5]NEO55357.1 hypothetical protein [Okeania sp. SIO3B5]